MYSVYEHAENIFSMAEMRHSEDFYLHFRKLMIDNSLQQISFTMNSTSNVYTCLCNFIDNQFTKKINIHCCILYVIKIFVNVKFLKIILKLT